MKSVEVGIVGIVASARVKRRTSKLLVGVCVDDA